jgi:hypothetical protein
VVLGVAGAAVGLGGAAYNLDLAVEQLEGAKAGQTGESVVDVDLSVAKDAIKWALIDVALSAADFALAARSVSAIAKARRAGKLGSKTGAKSEVSTKLTEAEPPTPRSKTTKPAEAQSGRESVSSPEPSRAKTKPKTTKPKPTKASTLRELKKEFPELNREQLKRLQWIEHDLGIMGAPIDSKGLKDFFGEYKSAGRTINEALDDAERAISNRCAILEPKHRPLRKAPRSRHTKRVPADVDPNLKGNVEYGSTDLSETAIQFRERENYWGDRNVAVVEFVDKQGDLQVIPILSGKKHSEKLLIESLRGFGIEPSQIKRIYTELNPCSYAGCSRYIQKVAPQAKVTWSFEYDYPGTSEAVRRMGVSERKRVLRELRSQK